REPRAEQDRHRLLAHEAHRARKQRGRADQPGVARDAQLFVHARGSRRARPRARDCGPWDRLLACAPMSPLQAIVLGSIQGLTEFLPVSSSAHLYVIPTLLHWRYAGVAFDVALHWGTLAALLAAFWRDWLALATAAVRGDDAGVAARSTGLKLVAASIPGAVAGILLKGAEETLLRQLPLQAVMLLVFGFLLWFVDAVRPMGPRVDAPGWGACMVIGCAQALALIPGVSRSGITITAA